MELRERRERPLGRREYVALVLDGVWFRRRGGRGKVVLLVAIGVRGDWGF
jgi:transposase-like protein